MGTGIFDDALAQEVRRAFESRVEAGLSIYAATNELLEKYSEGSSMVLYLALAALQLEHGLIQSKIKKKALTIINSGDGLDPWLDADPRVLETRRQVLQDLRQRLLSTY